MGNSEAVGTTAKQPTEPEGRAEEDLEDDQHVWLGCYYETGHKQRELVFSEDLWCPKPCAQLLKCFMCFHHLCKFLQWSTKALGLR